VNLDVGEPLVNARALRGHFEQAALDRLQLLSPLLAGADLDGDGESDTDPERISYVGVSLGGIMGTQFLALSPGIDASVLALAGGRLSLIATDSEMIGPLLGLLAPRGFGSGMVRFSSMLQTYIDPGDGAAWGPHVLQDRFDDEATGPDLLMGIALGDEVVPNSSS
jgi:hypothetical protein